MDAAENLELAQPSAPRRHLTVVNSYLPEKQPAPTPAPAPSESHIVTTSSVLDYSDSWSGFKLTPERLTWILRQADWGFPLQMYDMFEASVLADGHTRGLYEQRLDEQCVAWTWRAGDDRPDSIRVAQELDELTKPLDMDAAIEFGALAPFWGSSYIEVAWVSRADGRQIPVELVCVPHRRFVFDPMTSTPHLTSEKNSWPGDRLERRDGSSWMRFETNRWRKQSQAAILRTVAWWCLFKRMSVRDWMIFAEKFGIPMIVGKPGENDSETTRKTLKATIDALGTEGRAILGKDTTIEILNQALRTGGNGDHLHGGIVQLANSEISKCITAGTLTSDTGGPGSFALGQVHADQKHKLSLADALRIGRVFRRHLAQEYLIRNRLTEASAPFLHLHVQKLSLLTDAQVLKNLAGVGLPISISQLREKFEYRAPTDDADTLKVPAPQGADNADPADPREPATPPT